MELLVGDVRSRIGYSEVQSREQGIHNACLGTAADEIQRRY